jgi:phosphomannomutase
MIVDSSIFKSYDIRGIYGHNLHDQTAVAVGKGFAAVIKPQTVIVGRDARVSSPSLHKNIIEGLNSVGVNVIDVGMVSTDMYYYACAEKKLPGIMVTASHNPKEYNGFKMVRQIPYLLSGDEGIQDIRKVIEADAFPEQSATPGTVESWEIMDGFVQKILSLTPGYKDFKSFKVVADTANGMVGPSLLKLFEHIPQVTLVPMYFEPDGTFPNHGGDPLQEENRHDIIKKIEEEKADFGIMCDPDGDRFFVVDAHGRFISGDFFTAIMSYYFLQKNPNATIIYDIRASLAVPDTILKYGGKPLYNRVGHAYIKRRMADENGVFAGEVTGHYYFRDFYMCDSGVAPLFYLLDLLSNSKQTLEETVDQYETNYHISGEINNKVADVKGKIAEIKAKYAPLAKEVIEVDGVTCEMGDWRFNLRGSNTEPLIRLNLEAKTVELMEEKRDEILLLIKS